MERPTATRLQANVDMKQTTPVVCESCQGEAFQEALMLRKVSAILTGTGKEGFIPIQVFACTKCGHVNENFIPTELRRSILTPTG